MEKQETNELKVSSIDQIGIIVADVVKTAKRYSDIFGVGPWMFYDLTTTDVMLHGKPLGNVDVGVRMAVANLTGLEIELIQPLYGPGAHMEFFQKHARDIIEDWRTDYNEVRPYSSLKGSTPKEYAEITAGL